MKKGIFNTIFVLLVALAVKAQTPVAQFTASIQEGCSPLAVAFTDRSTGDPKYWNWDFGNGRLSNQQNPTTTYSAPGTYTVTLVVRNQNGVNAITKTDYITIFPSPSVGISANIRTACLPAAIQFTGTANTTAGTITSYAWDFGDGNTSTQQNPSHIYGQTGYYGVSLTATSSNGCVGRVGVGRYIRMVSGIEAAFLNTPSPECRPPFNVAFTNESSGPGTLTYQWDFGNGNTSTDPNPVAQFNTSGSYDVLLTTRSNNFGCTDTVRKTVAVNTFTTDFNNPDTVCIQQAVNFENTSAPGVQSFGWDFGDGTGSSEVSPSKTFTTAGTYTVKLVNRFSSCSDSLEKTIVVTNKPVVDFTATNAAGCQAPLVVDFQANAPSAASWQWDFGDGNQGTGATPQHTYTAAGEQNVTLTITTSGGCESSITKDRFVRIIPPVVTIPFSKAGGCVPMDVDPLAVVRAPDGVASYLWDFGNGSTSTSATPATVSYTTPGLFTVTLTVTTNGGCTATGTGTVRAGTRPTNTGFTYTTDGNCISDSVHFFGTADNANEWRWSFGDDDTAYVQNPVHIFKDTGRLTIKMEASYNGCPAPVVAKNNLIYRQPPVANFGFNLDCANRRSVAFIDSSLVDNNLPATYAWDFGDGQTSSSATPGTYTYATYGSYLVRLTVTNAACSATVEKTVNISPLDTTFSVSKNPLCRDERVTLTALENPANVQSYNWSLNGAAGFNGNSTLDTSFSALGNPAVRLTVTDKYGCTASSTQTLTITGPNALFQAASLTACKNGSIIFSDQSTADAGFASWAYDFGDGQTQIRSKLLYFFSLQRSTGRLLSKEGFQFL